MSDSKGCPDEFELCDLARGTISAERGAVLRDHIGDCPACRAAVANLASAPSNDVHGGAHEAARYVLQRLIATGGMGEVFLARDSVLDRDVAIKLLHEDASSAETRSRVQASREARALASLAHPNVVAVYDQGVLDGRAFLAMEYVHGRTLRQWIAGEAPKLPRIVDIVVQAGRGLLAAHAIGVVHRDFKPDNVLVGDDGRARVTDFGLARAASTCEAPVGETARAPTDGRITLDGTISGTPEYMAPEQRAGEAVDAQSDQYAFCVTAYEAIHGSRPPVSPRVERTARDDPRLARIDAVLQRGLSLHPAGRYPSMRDSPAGARGGRPGAAPCAQADTPPGGGRRAPRGRRVRVLRRAARLDREARARGPPRAVWRRSGRLPLSARLQVCRQQPLRRFRTTGRLQLAERRL